MTPKRTLERNAAWTKRNRPARLAYWRARNITPEVRAKSKARRKKLSELTPLEAERARKSKRANALKNASRLSAYGKAYRKANPEKTRAHNKANWHRRRALIAGASVNPKSIQLFMRGVRSKAFAVCYYCQSKVSTKRIHFDHITPLSKGGPHSVENLCVSCRDCNQSKHAKPLQDFITLGQQLLEL